MGTTEQKLAQRLLVRPSPVTGEGLRGYLLRVGERNGYEGRASLLRRLTGHCCNRYLVSEQTIDHLALYLNLSRDEIALMSYRRVPGDFSNCLFFGHLVAMKQLRGVHPAVCPECLREKRVTSGLWDLHAVCVCPDHGKWLVDLCPACGEALSWSRSCVTRCRCGFDLQTAEAEAAPSDVLMLTALIHQSVFNGVTRHHELSMCPLTAMKIPLSDLLQLFILASPILARGPFDKHKADQATQRFAAKGQVALLVAKLLLSSPSDRLMLLAQYAPSIRGASRASPFLQCNAFREAYWWLKPLGRLVPELFKSVVQQFLDEHYIYVKGRVRYLNPFAVWCEANGQRMLKRTTCQEALGLQIRGVREDEVISFDTFVHMKAELLGATAPDHRRCFRPPNRYGEEFSMTGYLNEDVIG